MFSKSIYIYAVVLYLHIWTLIVAHHLGLLLIPDFVPCWKFASLKFWSPSAGRKVSLAFFSVCLCALVGLLAFLNPGTSEKRSFDSFQWNLPKSTSSDLPTWKVFLWVVPYPSYFWEKQKRVYFTLPPQRWISFKKISGINSSVNGSSKRPPQLLPPVWLKTSLIQTE